MVLPQRLKGILPFRHNHQTTPNSPVFNTSPVAPPSALARPGYVPPNYFDFGAPDHAQNFAHIYAQDHAHNHVHIHTHDRAQNPALTHRHDHGQDHAFTHPHDHGHNHAFTRPHDQGYNHAFTHTPDHGQNHGQNEAGNYSQTPTQHNVPSLFQSFSQRPMECPPESSEQRAMSPPGPSASGNGNRGLKKSDERKAHPLNLKEIKGKDLAVSHGLMPRVTKEGVVAKKRGPKRDSKPALTRRQELNREAQRAHRERKEHYTKVLEDQNEVHKKDFKIFDEVINGYQALCDEHGIDSSHLRARLAAAGLLSDGDMADRENDDTEMAGTNPVQTQPAESQPTETQPPVTQPASAGLDHSESLASVQTVVPGRSGNVRTRNQMDYAGDVEDLPGGAASLPTAPDSVSPETLSSFTGFNSDQHTPVSMTSHSSPDSLEVQWTQEGASAAQGNPPEIEIANRYAPTTSYHPSQLTNMDFPDHVQDELVVNFDQDLLGLQFIFAIESTCRGHIVLANQLATATPEKQRNTTLSGHALMLSNPPAHHAAHRPNEPYEERDIPASALRELLSIAETVPMDNGEIMPIIALRNIRLDPRYELMTLTQFIELTMRLQGHARCYGFGTVVLEVAVDNEVDFIFGMGPVTPPTGWPRWGDWSHNCNLTRK